MTKFQAIKQLKDKGYTVIYKDGLIYFSEVHSVEDARAAVKEIGYDESWGVGKIKSDSFSHSEVVSDEEI